MSGNALPFVGKFYVYLVVFANTFKIQTKFKIQIHVPFCDFQYKYTKFLYSNIVTNTYLNPTLVQVYLLLRYSN